MYKDFKVTEVTKENESKYLDGIVELEDTVYENMIKQGKEGQLFTTGRDDISEYIHSRNNSVFIVTRDNNGDQVLAATYITQGQIPFTYNDVTKYFKFSEDYLQQIKNEFKDENEYLATIRKIYIQKITAFVYARDEVLRKHVSNIHELSEEEKNTKLLELVEAEKNNPENNFHEKSKIREDINRNMSLYMSKVFRNETLYEKLYWIDMDFLKKENSKKKNITTPGDNIKTETMNSKFSTTIEAYDKLLSLQKYDIHEKSQDMCEEKYYEANTSNTIELDTYITSDAVREFGLARIIVFEGIKRVLEKQHLNDSIFLVSTLHRDNLSSKYVSEFFGLKDNLFVTRRTGRDREVHICKIDKSEIKQYLEEIEKKLIVLYNYNPKGIVVSRAEKEQIIEAQLAYEVKELERLEKLHNEKYATYVEMKKRKISKLQLELEKINDEKNNIKEKNKTENAKDIGE